MRAGKPKRYIEQKQKQKDKTGKYHGNKPQLKKHLHNFRVYNLPNYPDICKHFFDKNRQNPYYDKNVIFMSNLVTKLLQIYQFPAHLP